ncbi:MAG: hypothetical protein HXY20_02020 [Acidobacteria bacterium]|nr:hypothetical protein [Acidobacteriota bacterium]
MSLVKALFGKKKQVPFDPNPEILDSIPARPYRVLHAGLPFYSDPDCRTEVQGARLVVLQCEDPAQQHHPIECMPVLKTYQKGQIVRWDTNHKLVWGAAWYVNPETGAKEKAWAQAVEFMGGVYRGWRATPAKS